jgi:predicted DNA-binding transcriptional regulator YafY
MSKGVMITRWMNLFMAIQGGRSYTIRELAERVGVSSRTIFRDLSGMQEAGIPLYYDDQTKSYRLTENFQMRPLQLTAADLLTLVGALNFMRRMGTLQARKNVAGLMDKLFAGLPLGQREEADRRDRALVVDPLGSYSLDDERVTAALDQALAQGRKIHMKYAALAHGGKEEERTVQPYGLAYRGTSLYLVGYCELRKSIRHFRLSRIRAITLLPDLYTIPADFDLNEYLTGLWGITEGPETQVRLRFRPAVAQLALETRWHPTQQSTQQDDGSVIVTLTTRGPVELSRWLVGYGGSVIVEEPEALREAVHALARGVLEG